MKIENPMTLSIAVLLFALGSLSRPVRADGPGSGGTRGGGDLCRNEIDKRRNEIRNWILADYAKDLDFPVARVPHLSYPVYREAMLRVLEEGAVTVACHLDPKLKNTPAMIKIAQEQKVDFESVTTGTEPVTCTNQVDQKGKARIDCDYMRVMAEANVDDPNYVLTHHEYATLAGMEMRLPEPLSDLSLSNQLARFEHQKTIKVLGEKIKAAPTEAPASDRVAPARLTILSDRAPSRMMIGYSTPVCRPSERVEVQGVVGRGVVCQTSAALISKEEDAPKILFVGSDCISKDPVPAKLQLHPNDGGEIYYGTVTCVRGGRGTAEFSYDE